MEGCKSWSKSEMNLGFHQEESVKGALQAQRRVNAKTEASKGNCSQDSCTQTEGQCGTNSGNPTLSVDCIVEQATQSF